MNRGKLEKWVVALYMLAKRDRFPKKDWPLEKREFAIRVTRWSERRIVECIDYILEYLERR